MQGISIKAHYDGTSIQLDEAVELPANVPLIVTVRAVDDQATRQEWHGVSAQGLAAAYGDNEPDYSADDIVP